jgi:Rrf2 family protein
MQILATTEAAIRALVYLAMAGPGKRVSGEEICREQKLAPALLIKSIRPLVRIGLVATFRGVGGGFRLAKPAESITLLEIIEAVQGPLVFNECLLQPGSCERDVFCPVHPVWREVRANVEKTLSLWTLSDLARSGRARGSILGESLGPSHSFSPLGRRSG